MKIKIRGDPFSKLEEKAKQAQVRAINYSARRTQTAASRSIRGDINLTAAYVNDHLKIKRFASQANPTAYISGRFRATKLNRFGSKVLKNRRGVSVKVKRKGSRKRMPGAFKMKLRNGNEGIAFRKDGKVKVLYGPSVDQLFRRVREELEPDTLNWIDTEFRRQMKL